MSKKIRNIVKVKEEEVAKNQELESLIQRVSLLNRNLDVLEVRQLECISTAANLEDKRLNHASSIITTGNKEPNRFEELTEDFEKLYNNIKMRYSGYVLQLVSAQQELKSIQQGSNGQAGSVDGNRGVCETVQASAESTPEPEGDSSMGSNTLGGADKDGEGKSLG